MTELEIYVTSRVRIFGEWHQPADVTQVPAVTDPLADPSALSLRIYRPDGQVENFTYPTDPEIIRDTGPRYHADYVVQVAGNHRCVWLPSGNAAQPAEVEFYAHAV